MKRRGLYGAIEGINGAGKSRLTARIRKYLSEELGIPCFQTRQIGGSVYGGALRQVLENEATRPQDNIAMLLAAASDRAENTAIVKSKIASGMWAISDRCELSMFVHQEHEGVNEDIIELTNLIASHVSPDFIFWIDVDLELAIQRVENRDGSLKKFSSAKSIQEAHELRALYYKHWILDTDGRIIYVPNPTSLWSEEATFGFIKIELDRIIKRWKDGEFDGTVPTPGERWSKEYAQEERKFKDEYEAFKYQPFRQNWAEVFSEAETETENWIPETEPDLTTFLKQTARDNNRDLRDLS